MIRTPAYSKVRILRKLTCMRIRIKLIAAQLLDLQPGQTARLHLTQSLGQIEQRLVVLCFGRLGRSQLGLAVRRQWQHRQEVEQKSRIGGRRLHAQVVVGGRGRLIRLDVHGRGSASRRGQRSMTGRMHRMVVMVVRVMVEIRLSVMLMRMMMLLMRIMMRMVMMRRYRGRRTLPMDTRIMATRLRQRSPQMMVMRALMMMRMMDNVDGRKRRRRWWWRWPVTSSGQGHTRVTNGGCGRRSCSRRSCMDCRSRQSSGRRMRRMMNVQRR